MTVWRPVYSSSVQLSTFLFKIRTKGLSLLLKALCYGLVFPKIFVQLLFSFCCLFKKRNFKVFSVDKWNTQVIHLHRISKRWFYAHPGSKPHFMLFVEGNVLIDILLTQTSKSEQKFQNRCLQKKKIWKALTKKKF